MIQAWRSPLEQQEGCISGLCIINPNSTHTMSTEGTGATTQPCLSPSFVWSRPCICRRNAPPSCWTWRSSRWCSRCRRRRCRPCVGCTWPACLSCESQKVSCVSGGFGEAPATRGLIPKNETKTGAVRGKGNLDLSRKVANGNAALWKERPADF